MNLFVFTNDCVFQQNNQVNKYQIDDQVLLAFWNQLSQASDIDEHDQVIEEHEEHFGMCPLFNHHDNNVVEGWIQQLTNNKTVGDCEETLCWAIGYDQQETMERLKQEMEKVD